MPSPYQLLPTAEEGDKTTEGLYQKLRREKTKRLLFHILAGCALMFLAIQGIRALARSSGRSMTGPGCHGPHRNLSSLPSHYTLPSGDEIPSVALGTVNSILDWIGGVHVYANHRCLEGRFWRGRQCCEGGLGGWIQAH